MGTTTLIKEMMPPPLAWWASGKALEKLGWTNPKYVSREEGIKEANHTYGWIHDSFDTAEQWYDFLQECYKVHDEFKKEAGTSGIDTHELIEQAVKEAIKDNAGFLKSETYENEAVERFAVWGRGKRFIYSEVHVYSEFLWLGGIVDLVYEENGEIYIGDIKTSKSIYPSQFIQEGLYDLQQSENGFFNELGAKVGDPLDVAGYTVINIPRAGGLNVKTYRNTKALKQLGMTLVEGYRTLQELETICK